MQQILYAFLMGAIVLLWSFLCTSDLRHGGEASQVTTTSTAYQYLPFVVRRWPLPSTPTATNTPDARLTATNTPTVTPAPTNTSTVTPTPTNTAITTTLFVWSGGLLKPQADPTDHFSEDICHYGRCAALRWKASLSSDMVGNQYGIGGRYEVCPGGTHTIYFRIILVHEGVEQTLKEVPVELTASCWAISFPMLFEGPDPTAVAGDEIIFEIDYARGPGYVWLKMYWGEMWGSWAARIVVPSTTTFPSTDSIEIMKCEPTDIAISAFSWKVAFARG